MEIDNRGDLPRKNQPRTDERRLDKSEICAIDGFAVRR